MTRTTRKNEEHGLFNTRQYKIWIGMKNRCYNKNNSSYKRYGDRGIKVCNKWKNSFILFWEDMKDTYKNTLSIDRIDNSKGYSKQNCRWATSKEQGGNKRNNIVFNGELQADAVKRLKCSHGTFRQRLKRGWSIEKTFTTPVMKKYINKAYKIKHK